MSEHYSRRFSPHIHPLPPFPGEVPPALSNRTNEQDYGGHTASAEQFHPFPGEVVLPSNGTHPDSLPMTGLIVDKPKTGHGSS